MFDGFWYRCEVRHYSVADEWGDHSYSTSQVVWTKYAVVRETQKGVWLCSVPWSFSYWPDQRPRSLSGGSYVLGTAMRQLACPTKEAALADAIARKKRHIWGCQARLQEATNDLQALEFEQLKLCPQKTKDPV